MNWQDIKVSADNTHFIFKDKPVFSKRFIEVLKFHSPGLAPVKDATGSYHIESSGNQLYSKRFTRTFGYYCNRATVVQDDKWFHLTDKGERAYSLSFSWAGNFQENLCTVRNSNNNYFHIGLNGEKFYSDIFIYAGDYKDGYACVKTPSGLYKHIDCKGIFLNEKEFYDLRVFHKKYATAKDENGWHHIDKNGSELYSKRYSMIEPFYNGFAVVKTFENKKQIIDEKGNKILEI